MHHTGLDHRVRPGRLDRLREAGQPVTAGDQHIFDAPVGELGAHPGPKLGALSGLDPDAEDMLDAVGVDPDRDVSGLVPDGVGVLDLHHQRVEVDDRIHRLQRPRLPRLHLLGHRVGDVGDRLVRQLRTHRPFQMGLNAADRHPPGIQADDHVRQAAHPPLALRHQPGLEAGVPVPRDRQINIADLGPQPLRGIAIAGVARPVTGPVILLIAQMISPLRLQTGLQNPPHHLGQKPALPGQL